MHINIELPRPGLTLLLMAGLAWVITDITYFHGHTKVQADVQQRQDQSTEPDQDHDHAYAADLLDAKGGDDTDDAVKLKRAEEDVRTAEQFMLASLNQIRDAQGRAQSLGLRLGALEEDIRLSWPVDPSRGISAPFHDAAYEERFGFVHEGTDMRALQGDDVYAAADGYVKDVTDN